MLGGIPFGLCSSAGAVGSAVGQIAKITSCRTIGITGGPAKCRELFGYDAAIDYKSGDFASALAASRPNALTSISTIQEVR
jgi:NADPH-dependent curcumin reductase